MGARRLTFRALPTGCGPVGRLRPGSLPRRGGSLHGQPSSVEEERRNPSSRLATERRGEEKDCELVGVGGQYVGETGGALWRLGFGPRVGLVSWPN
jgi:hypothetical protein